MIRVRQVIVDINKDNEEHLKKKLAKKLNISEKEIPNYKINKKSIDARKKDNINYVYEIDLALENEDYILKKNYSKDIIKINDLKYCYRITGNIKLNKRPIIVGSGPCGLFVSYMLSEAGYKPLILERGKDIDSRIKDVEEFWEYGKLNVNSNVQFGEGGAGTFSDGKLNTLVKDKNNRIKKVLEVFVENGAPEEILYEHNPHIGTNILRDVVKNMRNKIILNGGSFKYNSCVTDIKIIDNKINGIEINNEEIIDTDLVVIAIGHSARDTFKMLHSRGLLLENKPFAVGLRIMHPQELINRNQYGKYSNILKPASYKLTYNINNRGIYSFCMCPGGYVVNSSSEDGKLVVNGMSNYERESKVANSALIITVNEKDYGTNLFDGIKYQEKLEKKAYELCNGKIPVQLVGDYHKNIQSNTFNDFLPMIKGEYNFANLNELFDKELNDVLKKGLEYFDKKIPGFNEDSAILAGVESRTSSPVRILRDEQCLSNVDGIYPGGEGAGYAGGITSAAVDGIVIFEKIISKYIVD